MAGRLPTYAPYAEPARTQATYALCGEPGRTQATEALHCERIAERSQRHDWRIAPHRHAWLFQILHSQRGHARATLESHSLPLAGRCVLLVPALVPHGFVFAPDIQRSVITVLAPHLQRLLHGAPPLAARRLQARLLQWPDGAMAHGPMAPWQWTTPWPSWWLPTLAPAIGAI